MNTFAASKVRRPSAGPVRAMQQVGAGLAVKEAPALPTLDEMIQRQDFTGAVTLLQFQKQAGEGGPLAQPWLAYAHFHLGDYAKALDVYTKLQAEDPANGDYHLYAACCHFYLGHYKEAIAEAKQGAATGSPAKQRLRNRVLMHCAYKVNNTALLDEASAACAHASAQGSIHDALSVAALQFMRCQFQEAADEYQRIIKENLDCDAVNMYIALCLYKLDHFRISLDFVSKYVAKFPDSASALNLRACNHFRVFDSARADADLQLLADKLQSSAHAFGRELVEHNTVVFRGGQDAVKVLPPLLDVVPEARFNLTVHHLRAGELEDALSLVKDLEPKTPQEYVIKAVAYAAIGVANDSAEFIKEARSLFTAVGSSESERDTIPGRKCMAQFYFFERRWEDVLIYLNSIAEYCSADASFNVNLGIALAGNGEWEEAAKRFLVVPDTDPEAETFSYRAWLARCHINRGAPDDAWGIYLKLETQGSVDMLLLIATDCYRAGHFYHAYKAYSTLHRLDASAEHWEGKLGAAAGTLQLVLADQLPKTAMREVISDLRVSAPPGDSETHHVLQTLLRWAQANGVKFD